jgi:hypothetical protein
MQTRHPIAGFMLGLLLAMASIASASGVDPTVATVQQKGEAQAHFAKAHALFGDKQFDRALEEAKASWRVVASPNARILIARCLRELGKTAEAYREYSATIDEANALAPKEARYQETAKAATDERAALEKQLGPAERATLATDVGVTPAVPPPGPPPAAEPSEEPEPSQPANVVPASRSGRQKLRLPAYVAGGVGAVGFVFFGIFGALDNSTYSSLQSGCPNNLCPASKAGDISTGKTQQLVANVGLALGIAGIATGATLFTISLTGKSGGAAPDADRKASLVLSPNFVGLRGAL